MSYSDLFDGEEHWLAVECVPGWIKPYMQVTDVVELQPQPAAVGDLESPLTNLVSSPVLPAAERSWAVEEGWQAFAVMSQYIGDLLTPGGDTNLLEVEQLVARDHKTWAIKSSHYRVIWKGDDVEC
jgi:hypothetical protein